MKRYLVLENGEVFAGLAFGAPCDTVGELVFTTGMNGYIETLTDPSYCGQIVLQTFPLIGNYGIIPADFEGKCCVRGYVVREQCQTPSNFRCEETLDAFLKANNIPGIAGIDTRAVTRILREAGTYLGTALPYAMTGLLVVYSLKGVHLLSGSHGIPELLAIMVIVLLHVWKRNMLLSIAGGTAAYMLLVQLVFS